MERIVLHHRLAKGDRTIEVKMTNGIVAVFENVGPGQMFEADQAARRVFGTFVKETISIPKGK